MGTFLYGTTGTAITIDDRALAHLQLVITSKLRRGESFTFTWTESAKAGSGRSTAWLAPSSDILFRYLGNRQPAINREWIEVLINSANSTGGLHLIVEPGLEALPVHRT